MKNWFFKYVRQNLKLSVLEQKQELSDSKKYFLKLKKLRICQD